MEFTVRERQILRNAITSFENFEHYPDMKLIKSIREKLGFHEDVAKMYDKNYGDKKLCKCGHTYYRHFDTYEQMKAVGCKYCYCNEFEEG